MNSNDKLIFELGEGFNILTPDEISKNEDIFKEYLKEAQEDYGYSGDGPYDEAVYEFAHYLYHKYYKKPEKFISAIIAHNNWDTFGWALKALKDDEIYNYAKKYMYNILSKEDLDKDDIELILTEQSLPS